MSYSRSTRWNSYDDVLESLLIEEEFNNLEYVEITGDVDVPYFPPKLKTLIWHNGGMFTQLPPSLPKTITTLCFHNSGLIELNDLWDGLKHLEIVNSNLIYVNTFPKTLQILSLSNNQLCSVPEFPPDLTTIRLENNRLTEISDSVLKCSKLQRFNLRGNPVIYSTDQIMFLYRFLCQVNYYQHSENVEYASTQESLATSITNLLKDDVNKDLRKEMETNMSSIVEWTKNKIIQELPQLKNTQWAKIKYRPTTILYGKKLTVTIEELWIRIWNRILSSPNKHELMIRFTQEMIEANNYCDTGYKTRLVNILSGFYDDIRIGLSSSEQMGELIQASRIKTSKTIKESDPRFYDVWKNEVTQMFAERNIDIAMLQEWIAPLL